MSFITPDVAKRCRHGTIYFIRIVAGFISGYSCSYDVGETKHVN